jgi:DNA-binding NarL/FixJ family response regulator
VSDDTNVQLRLTAREIDVLRLAAEGHTNPQIAAALGLTHNTAKTYMQRTLEKLGAPNRTAAVTTAYRAGILSIGGRP